MPGAIVSNEARDQNPVPAFTVPVSTSSTLNTILSMETRQSVNEMAYAFAQLAQLVQLTRRPFHLIAVEVVAESVAWLGITEKLGGLVDASERPKVDGRLNVLDTDIFTLSVRVVAITSRYNQIDFAG